MSNIVWDASNPLYVLIFVLYVSLCSISIVKGR